MRNYIVAFLLLGYLGLLFGVFWCPRSGPRDVHELCVANDGSFTTSSWDSDTSQKGDLDYWGPDLTHRKTIELSGYLAGWAHALSPDGDVVAAATTADGWSQSIEVVNLANNTPRLAIDAPTRRLPLRLYFCGNSKSEFLISDGNNAFVCSQDHKRNQKFQARESWPLAASQSQYLAISNLLAGAADTSGEVHYDKEISFYAADTRPLKLLYHEKRSIDDWHGQGVAIGDDGTIAIQHPGHIQFRHSDGSRRQIEWPMERGKLWRFDPTMAYMLFTDEKRVMGNKAMIVSVDNGQVLAHRTTENPWWFWQCQFQDASHLLFTEQFNGDPSGSVSGRIVRWNWRDDTVTTQSVGGVDAQVFNRRLKWLGFAVLLWFLVATGAARTSRRWITPTVILVATAFLCGVWAYHHPELERYYLDAEFRFRNLPSLVLSTVWLAIPTLTCVAVCRAPALITRRLPIVVLVASISISRLHHLTASGSWFFPQTLLFVLTWILGISVIIRVCKYWRSKSGRRLKTPPEHSSMSSYRLMDLFLLIGAIAVSLAVLSNFDEFDQSWASFKWSVTLSVAVAFQAGLSVWAGLARSAWWKRYVPLIGCTFLIAWGFDQFHWIEAGTQAPMLFGYHLAGVLIALAIVITYAAWLYRGTMVCSQPVESRNDAEFLAA